MANNGNSASNRASTQTPASPLGSPVMWAIATSLLWGLTAVIPCAIEAAVAGTVVALGATNSLIALGALAGAGLVLGLLWRGAVGKTALGLTLVIVIATAFGGYLGAGPVLKQAMAGGLGTLNLSSSNFITAGAFAFQSAWFVLAFSIRRVNKKSAWWLLLVGAALSPALMLIP